MDSIETLIDSFVNTEYNLICDLAKDPSLPLLKGTGIEAIRLDAVKNSYPDMVQVLAYLRLREEGIDPAYVCSLELNLRAIEIAHEQGLHQIDGQQYRSIFRQVYDEVGRDRVQLLLLSPKENRDPLSVARRSLVQKHIDYLFSGEPTKQT